MRLVRSGGGADDTVAGQVKVGKLCVFAVDLELHRSSGRVAGAAADVCNLVFEAIWKHDLRPRFCASHRIADRLGGHFNIAGNTELAAPAVDINLELDRCEDR